MLTIQDRADSYAQSSPIHRPLDVAHTEDGGRLEGLWILGNNYRGSGYHGAFPPGFMRRVRAMFPDFKQMVHLFSGSLPPDPDTIRVDMNPANNPDICADAHDLGFMVRGKHLVVADPPYTGEDCDHYGVPLIRRGVVLGQLRRVLEPGSFLVWLDQVWPMYSKRDWILRGLIGVVRSTNHRARVVTILEKK